jgi:metal-responsive CopG/Arc/MetJ family transcriptional regulator
MAKMGRPKTETKGVMVRVSEDMLQSIDDVRRNEADVPTRPEMIRRILAEWLEQKPKAEDSGLS